MLGWRLLFAHHFYAEAWTASGDRSRRRPKEILGQVTRSTSTNWGSTLPLFAFQKKNVLCVPCYLTCTNFLRPLMLMIAVRCIHKGVFFSSLDANDAHTWSCLVFRTRFVIQGSKDPTLDPAGILISSSVFKGSPGCTSSEATCSFFTSKHFSSTLNLFYRTSFASITHTFTFC